MTNVLASRLQQVVVKADRTAAPAVKEPHFCRRGTCATSSKSKQRHAQVKELQILSKGTCATSFRNQLKRQTAPLGTAAGSWRLERPHELAFAATGAITGQALPDRILHEHVAWYSIA